MLTNRTTLIRIVSSSPVCRGPLEAQSRQFAWHYSTTHKHDSRSFDSLLHTGDVDSDDVHYCCLGPFPSPHICHFVLISQISLPASFHFSPLIPPPPTMPPPKTITLRFESREGQFRLQVSPKDEFTSLLSPVRDWSLLFQLRAQSDYDRF